MLAILGHPFYLLKLHCILEVRTSSSVQEGATTPMTYTGIILLFVCFLSSLMHITILIFFLFFFHTKTLLSTVYPCVLSSMHFSVCHYLSKIPCIFLHIDIALNFSFSSSALPSPTPQPHHHEIFLKSNQLYL